VAEEEGGDVSERDPAVLTFKAEQTTDYQLLCEYLKNSSPVVREGAVYGLVALRDKIDSLLEHIAKEDPSPGVREAAAEAKDQ